VTKANLIWANESNKFETLDDSDCLLILTTPELLASQLFHFSTPAKAYIEQVFDDEGLQEITANAYSYKALRRLKQVTSQTLKTAEKTKLANN